MSVKLHGLDIVRTESESSIQTTHFIVVRARSRAEIRFVGRFAPDELFSPDFGVQHADTSS